MDDIGKIIKNIIKKDPDGFEMAVTLAFATRIEDKYNEFIKDLDLDETDKENILLGMIEKEYEDWDDDDDEEEEAGEETWE